MAQRKGYLFVRAAMRTTAAASVPLSIIIAGAVYHRPQPDLEQYDWGGPKHYPFKPLTEDQRASVLWFNRLQVCQEKDSNSACAIPNPTTRDADSSRTRENLKSTARDDYDDGSSVLATDGGSEPEISRSKQGVLGSFLEEIRDQILELGYRITQFTVLGAVNATIWIGMNGLYNSHEILQDSHYHNLIKTIRRLKKAERSHTAGINVSNRSRNNQTEKNSAKPNKEQPLTEALLTVSNHASTIDDPVLFGVLLPTDLKHDPYNVRWTLCSQEICFKATAKAAIFGAGKVMPIRRGGGIDQPLFLRFAQKVAAGSWIHVFPEGKIVQSGELGENYYGTRSVEDASSIGRLKWGVGKIIAHSPVDLHVVPIHHIGMEGVVPQKITGELTQVHPAGGNDVKLRVGARIQFDDLIHEHEVQHGALARYSAEEAPDEQQKWQSSYLERQLYSRITRRVENALKQLETDSRADPSAISAYRKLVKS